jgi:hypothetical protein
MDYIIAIFLLGLIVTFVVVVGLARAAEFARVDSAQRLEIDPLPDEWNELAPPKRNV